MTAEPQADVTRCPICGRPASARHRPFCSVRCAEIDLGRWLGGHYRIPAPENDEEDRPADDLPG
jgi:hypothetical protein